MVVKDFPDGPHLFDRDGVDFATAPPPPALPYFDVDNPGPTDPADQGRAAGDDRAAPEVAGQVGRVAAPSVASITLTLVDGRVVVWGSTDRTDGEGAEAGGVADPARADLRRVEPGPADRQVSGSAAKFGDRPRNLPVASARLHGKPAAALLFRLRGTT